MEKKYPLDLLHCVRVRRVQQKAADLASASRQVAESQALAADRQRAKDEFDTECREIEREEHTQLEQGTLSVSDLLNGAAWAVGREIERATHAQQLAEAQRALAEAGAAADRERALLARARTEADVVERDRARWEHAAREKRWKAEDEEAEEMHLGRTSPSGAK